MIYADTKITLNLDQVENVAINGRDSSMLDIIFTNSKNFSVRYNNAEDANEAYVAIRSGIVKYDIEVQNTIKEGTEIAKIRVNDVEMPMYMTDIEVLTKEEIESICSMSIEYDADDGCHCEAITDDEISDIFK